ncbi:MAG: methyltransferase [Deltaproteobacteria bacterium]|nr:methyltransferase [Deltaproteobacteria bacterium]
MRVGVVADNLVESLALTAGAVPEPVVLGAWGLFASRLLLAGAKLGVFDALTDRTADAATLAKELGLSVEGLERLLRALNGLGYLKRSRGRYSLSALSKKWLARGSKSSMKDALLFLEELWSWTSHLEAGVRTGRGIRLHDDGVLSPESWGRYLRGLATFAAPAGKEIVRRIKFARPPAKLLDVGGGHGMYSVEFCRRHPGLKAEVLDLPEAAAHGRKIVEEAGFDARVTFRPGDMRTDEWGTGYDAILLFNVLHNATEAEAKVVLRKARAAIAPGGVLAIQESEYKQTEGDLSFTAGFGELFFFLVSGAQTWPEPTLRAWLVEAGFERVRTQRLWLAPAVVVSGLGPKG